MLTEPTLTVSPIEAFARLVQGKTGILYLVGGDHFFFQVMEVIDGPVQVTAYGSVVTYIYAANMFKEVFEVFLLYVFHG